MYKSSFGRKGQIKFPTVASYYKFIGYLGKNDGSTRIVVENNDDQGAWGKEGRIEFVNDVPLQLTVKLKHTAGNSGVKSRINCNEFIEDLIHNHNFVINGQQDLSLIRKTIPINYMEFFESGLNL